MIPKPRVLIVEEGAALSPVLDAMLVDSYSTIVTRSVSEAIHVMADRLAAGAQVDVVVLVVGHAGRARDLGDYEPISLLQATMPRSRVVAVTNDEPGTHRTSLDAGAVAVVRTPLDRTDVLYRVEEALRSRTVYEVLWALAEELRLFADDLHERISSDYPTLTTSTSTYTAGVPA
jgi:AmiR/NasT family two-component response regulator